MTIKINNNNKTNLRVALAEIAQITAEPREWDVLENGL